MLDLLTIFGKGGIVLWCFQGTAAVLDQSVNALIRDVLLQVRACTPGPARVVAGAQQQ
jgi:signal recognition particle receptor subunit alpha